MTEPAAKQDQPEDAADGQAIHTDFFVRRKISVNGSGGVAATVVVTVQRGQVWVSIQPLFTWEAIMEPGKVDELIHTLAQARQDAKKMAASRRNRR